MVTNAREICTRALRMIGKAAGGQAISANDMNDTYAILKDMVDAWLLDNLTILVNAVQDFPLVNGQQDYTIGPGGNFNVARPPDIFNEGNVSVIQNSNPSQQLELPLDILTIGQWQSIPTKQTQSALPTSMYYAQAYPLGTMKFWPIPNVNYLLARLYLPLPALQSPFTTLETVVDLPPGYKIGLQYNLAVLLGPEWGAPIDPVIATKASDFLGDIRRKNIKPVQARVDDAIVATSNQWNYLTGNTGPGYGGN